MKTQELFELIDGIDDDIILDIPQLNAEKPTKITVQKRDPVWNYVSIAACLVCVIAIGIFAVTKIHGNITTSLPVTPSDMTGSGAASSIPENNSAPVQTSEPGQTAPYYDDVFKELEPVNPVIGAPMTYEDHMDTITSQYEQEHGIFLDSFYLVETIRALSGEEARALQGWDILCEGRTIYEVRLLKDLISGETVDRVEKIIVPHGTPDRQTPGDPSYAPGERFTALLAKPLLVGDFLQSPSSKDFRYDVVENGSEITIYSRGSDLDKLGLPGSENIEEQVITSTTQNPAVHTQRISLEALSDFLRSDWEKRGISSHFETVDLGNGMTLAGTPLGRSELEEFSVEPYISGYVFDEAEEKFLDSLGVPELKDLYKRAKYLTRYSSSTTEFTPAFAAAGNGRKPAKIRTADGRRYDEWGYTYESFNNTYLSTFTKETVNNIFTKYGLFLEHNGALFCEIVSRGGWLGEVHREFELISKSGSAVEFRILTFHKDSENKPAAEYVPELRDKYGIGVTEFKFVLTEDGWRAANIPEEYEKKDQAEQTSNQTGSPNAYLDTRPVTFSEAEDQINFTDVKKITSADFIGYEIEYVMPSNYPLALNYVYSGGRVSVSDNIGGPGKIVISPEWYEKIERGNMVFWRSLLYDIPAAVYISESDTVYFAEFTSDADLSKAIEKIMSLL